LVGNVLVRLSWRTRRVNAGIPAIRASGRNGFLGGRRDNLRNGRYPAHISKYFQIGENEMKKKNVLIVTRHAPLVEWLRQHGIEGNVIAQATPADVAGKDVYGILPMWLAAEANSVTEVSMPGLPLEARAKVNGGDFTVDQMDEWGACLKSFVVRKAAYARWLEEK
jgi:putative CRISPR-associated protein (TIGR02620 family)